MAKRVLILIDEGNVSASAHDVGRAVDWDALREKLVRSEAGRECIETVIYTGLPPLAEGYEEHRQAKEDFVFRLQARGYLVVTQEGAPREGGHYKANLDVYMAVDAVDLSVEMKPDVVVLCTGDSDFAHLALRLRRRGVRVEVASASDSMSSRLRAAANETIDLDALIAAFPRGHDRDYPSSRASRSS